MPAATGDDKIARFVRWKVRFLVGAVLLCVAAVSVSAQSSEDAAAQRLQEQITVDVIEVPVHVTRGGKAVPDLTRDQFELYVNGKRHPFEYFDVVDQRQAASDDTIPGEKAPPEVELDRRRMTVLLFDTATTPHHRLRRASEAAQKFVAEASAGDTFAVARLTRDGVKFVVPFTMDRTVVLRAVKTLQPSQAGDVFSLAMLQSERAMGVQAGPDMMDRTNDVEPFRISGLRATAREEGETAFTDDIELRVGAALEYGKTVNDQSRVDEQGRSAMHLAALADRLAPISGVKHVVLLTQGSGIGATTHFAAKMHERFQAANVILDAVELEGLRVPGLLAESRVQNSQYTAPSLTRTPDVTDPLYTLALGTGGTVSTHGDIAEGLRYLRDMQGVTYVLGFRPPNTGKKDNVIKVKVRDQRLGTTVTYRRGYSTAPRRDLGDGLFLADVLMNDIPQNGLTLDLNVERDREGAKVVASVPGNELLAHGSVGQALLVDVFLYLFDEGDRVVSWGYWRLQLDLEKGRDFLSANPYAVQKWFPLGSGRYSAKALLRFAGSDITGFQRADFQIAAQ